VGHRKVSGNCRRIRRRAEHENRASVVVRLGNDLRHNDAREATRSMTGLDFEPLLDELADRVADRLRPLLAPAPGAESWRLLDVEQVADRLGRSTRWVRERAKRGDLPYIRLDGGAFAFDEADLRAFAHARRVSAEDPEVCAGRVQEGRDRALRNGSGAADRVENRRVRP
jgi:hypothetical protein